MAGEDKPNIPNKQYVKTKLITTVCEYEFVGRYVRELETDNWHYYEKEDGIILHVRKEHLVMVIGGDMEYTKANKEPNPFKTGKHGS